MSLNTQYAARLGDGGRQLGLIQEILEETRADEIIVTAQVFNHAARLRSFEIAAGVFASIKTT